MNESINTIDKDKIESECIIETWSIEIMFLNYYIFTISQVKDTSRFISNLKKRFISHSQSNV